MTIVCLISPTCKVGMTILSTYLPHRGVVGIHVVKLYGALSLLEVVRYEHNILFFIVLHVSEDLRAKEFHNPGNNSHSH